MCSLMFKAIESNDVYVINALSSILEVAMLVRAPTVLVRIGGTPLIDGRCISSTLDCRLSTSAAFTAFDSNVKGS